MIKTAALQLNSQGLSSTKLYNYIRVANKKGVDILVLGEYVLNPFFHELKELSLDIINEQSNQYIDILKTNAQDYNLTIIAPLVIVKNKKPYKVIVKISPKSTKYYYQQILINYPHWDEKSFFANETKELNTPMVFNKGGLKFGVMFGFELHFDTFFEMLDAKNIDCLIVPSISTFNSNQRWNSLVTTRAFTHNIYILRVNRIGKYTQDETVWEFYGQSILSDPNGEIINSLLDEEELMIDTIDKEIVKEAKKNWKFNILKANLDKI